MDQPAPQPSAPASIKIQPIGIIRSCFPEKFGIPRQPGLVPDATGTIELYDWIASDSLEGLEQFSHLWVFFQFHKAVARGWKPRVRPPRLGGNKKVGVFASRSPQRPNFLGHSVVAIQGVDQARGLIHIGGIDLLDGTPVIDIKPYIPYTDSLLHAAEGYAPKPVHHFDILFTPESEQACTKYQSQHDVNLQQLIRQILQQDPRPAYHKDDRTYGMRLWDLNIRFTYTSSTITVEHIHKSPT
ncbi:MAG: tRNA (N6-threonylcarbamoyladenosine(37)-N6)-methyltransferase TrmO [Desulfobulbaceae bacterium]|jgi:tRNA-Thr(GGU) m(6)t(6)A37 methyltransferase TsaA|nr:tRNA (N6-threonylcarbamoyladenosine(37)-N6)-methyltransferase TrmO [Desulfobulbaceae bacterium]